ncbi:MAG TPA: hypothetical protein VHT96_12075 [Clostridia bacterium]|nr:hypothetical protein [Clostridia bacterium]
MVNGNSKKQVQIRSFNNMWYKFLITYGILGVFFFFCINSVLDNVIKIFSQMFVKDFWMDGSDFSVLLNLLFAPVFLIALIFYFGALFIVEFIAILLFKSAYFNCMVIDEERANLSRNIKIAIWCFILANILGVLLWGDMKRSILFVLFYLPVPLLAASNIYSKIKIMW